MLTNTIPQWLLNALTEQRLSLALPTLARREYQRECFRTISRRQVRLPSPSSPSSPDSSPKDSSPSREASAYAVSQGHYSVAVANQEDNINRNRYVDVVPYDRTRVIVGDGIDGAGRYLNANWVLERFGHKWWIATQAPLPSTAHAFLSVIFQPTSIPFHSLSSVPDAQEEAKRNVSYYRTSRIRTVVQLTKNVESGKTKAHPYFPSQVGQTVIVPPETGCTLPALKVTLLQSRTHENAQCVQSTISIIPVETNSKGPYSGTLKSHEKLFGNQGIVFQHLLYTAWPDHGVPEDGDRQSLFEFIKLVDRTNRDLTLCSYPPMSQLSEGQKRYDPDPPIMVGCSAGIGRTGTFIALSSLLRCHGFIQLAASPTPASVLPPSPLGALPEELVGDYVVEEIDSLREQRPRMVERQEQVTLIYELLIDAFQTRVATLY